MSKKKVSNIYGQVYGFSKKVITSLDQLYPGDHIAYERVKLYWHHVIVEDINKMSDEVHVIHYHNNVKEFFETTLHEGSLAQVTRSTIQFWSGRFYCIVYGDVEVNPPEKVLELACERLGETKYHPILGNCEHFCTECKIGKSISIQVDSLVELTIATVVPTLTRALLELLLKKTVQKSIEEFTKTTAKRCVQEILTKLPQTVFRIALLRCIGFVGTQTVWTSLRQNAAVIVESIVASQAKQLYRVGAKEIVKTAGQNLAAMKVSENRSPSRKGVCRMTKSGVLADDSMASPVNRVSGGRGRGRAKALAAVIGNPGENGKQKYVTLNITSKSKEDDIFQQVEEAVDFSLRETTPQNLNFCLSKVDEFSTDEEKIAKVVNTLIEKCLKEKSLAVNGGQLAAVFISSQKIGLKFRDIFLQKFQEMYKNREQQRKTEFEKYLCFSVFLSSVFKDVLVQGKVMKILTKPVYTMLAELLDEKNEEPWQREKVIEVFRDNLLRVAVLLQETDKGQMEELFKTVRIKIIKETSPKVSCILLQTFECYSSDDWIFKNETKEFYTDLINDVSTKS